MRAKVIKTEFGWEPAFDTGNGEGYVIEDGFAKPTRAEAQAALDASLECESESRYAAQYAHACGYID